MPFINTSDVPADRPIDTTRKSGASVVFKQSTPAFILDEYPLFVEFLEAYYEWLDQEGNPIEFLSNGNKYFDIDTTSDLFLEHFKKTFLDGFPKRLTSADTGVQVFDDRTLIKNIREFARFDASARTNLPLLSYATMLPCLKPFPPEIFTSILLVGLRKTSNGLLPKILVVDMKFSYQIRP